MRRGIAALVLCTAMLLTGCADSASSQQAELTPPFWVAEDAGTGAKLYLLGSMHVGSRYAGYPEYVMQAFDESGVVAAELDVTQTGESAFEAAKLLLCPEGLTAADCFGEEYDSVVEFYKRKGLYSRTLDSYIPYFWGSYISVAAAEDCGLSSEYGTEEYFLSLAHEDGKEIVEIESYEEQYRMMSEIPMSVQVQAVTDSIGERYDELVKETLSLYEAWAGFDEEALEALNISVYESISAEMSEDYAVFMDKVYFSRQELMADKAAELLQSGETAFMLVGAAHFYIEDDILTLLEADGYTITKICPENAEQAA